LPLPFQLPRVSSESSDSDTNTDQDLNHKNTGSGDSENFNCGENLIDSAVSAICSTGPSTPPPPEPETATLSVCKESIIHILIEFTFTVEGNGPVPDEFFLTDGNCVDVSIGPGEYTVTETDITQFATISGNCVQDPTNRLGAIGEIQAGEAQVCIFTNRL
jgi:hypothetical protein